MEATCLTDYLDFHGTHELVAFQKIDGEVSPLSHLDSEFKLGTDRTVHHRKLTDGHRCGITPRPYARP